MPSGPVWLAGPAGTEARFSAHEIASTLTGRRSAAVLPRGGPPGPLSQFLSHWCTILMSVAVRLLMHPRCRQATALLVSDACDVLNEFRGAWRFPGRADRRQGCMRR